MELDEYVNKLLKELSQQNSKKKVKAGSLGNQSDWLDFCDISLKSNKLMIADASFIPEEEKGLIVDLIPGKYKLKVKIINYANDLRTVRLRIFEKDQSPKLGKLIGHTWTDTAKTGLCDYNTFLSCFNMDDGDSSYSVYSEILENEDYGIAVLDEEKGAVMPFIESGFGDGEFPVYELTSGGNIVGIEIEFINANEPYPF